MSSVPPEQCVPRAESLARAFQFLGKRWTAVLLGRLSEGPVGFRELSRAVGGSATRCSRIGCPTSRRAGS